MCDEQAPDGANWCEACGSDLGASPAPSCVSCGGKPISDDGYCLVCGHKQPAERDRVEAAGAAVVAISDRGLRHHHNEDAVAMAELVGGGALLLVCDGVSTTPGSADASIAAAEAARDLLVERLGSQPGSEAGSQPEFISDPGSHSKSDPDPDPDPESESASDRDQDRTEVDQALAAATQAAQAATAAVGTVEGGVITANAPSTTFVAVYARPGGDGVRLGVAWVGDSRAYWIDADGATQLTTDHELQGSLTRWLGADAIGVVADIAHFEVAGPGLVVVCSDGLWRYADPPPELKALVDRLQTDPPDTAGLAAALVAHAIDGGGHDNISVALWPTPAPLPVAAAETGPGPADPNAGTGNSDSDNSDPDKSGTGNSGDVESESSDE